MLIRVVTLADLINKVDLILNCTLTMPYIVVLSYTLVLSFQNAKNWLYPTIDRLDAPILIIIPINLSIVITEWLKALLAKIVAIEIALCCFTWPKEV